MMINGIFLSLISCGKTGVLVVRVLIVEDDNWIFDKKKYESFTKFSLYSGEKCILV